MNVTSDFFADCVNAAQNFLQTAVIIDDKLFEHRKEPVPRRLEKNKARKPAVRKQKDDHSQEKNYVPSDQDPHSVSTQDLIHSFAKKRIICSAYQPKRRSFSTGTGGEFRKLCENADIIIVDWSMFGDDGQRAKDLISGIVLEGLNETPEQLRLIVAYTGEPNLFEIMNKIYDHLQNLKPDILAPEKEDNLAMRCGASRVVVLGKKNGRDRLEKYIKNEVNEAELADRAINEYAMMTSGLISNVALHSMAHLRGNSRKIISKFSPDLDAAFLSHRILSLPDENAESHLLDMLASEFYAVIEDCLDNNILPNKRVEQWIEHFKTNIQDGVDKLGKYPDKTDSHNDIKRLCIEGADIFKDIKKHPFSFLKKNGKNGIIMRTKLSQALSAKEDYYGDYILAHNMALRTFYSNKYRTLSLGTILYRKIEENKSKRIKEYWLCVQPRCDAVRLGNETPFPFLQCKIIPNDDYDRKRSIVLFEDDKPLCLNVPCKPNSLGIFLFKPDQTKQIVAQYENTAKSFSFNSVDGSKFSWVGELKFEHAQRIANELAQQLSRVGLAESEWLRTYTSQKSRV